MQTTLPTILPNVLMIVAVAVVAIVVIAVFAKLFGGGRHAEKEYPFARRDSMLAETERAFLIALKEAIGSRCLIFPKVRLADVIRPADKLGRADYFKALNRVAQK